MKVISIEGDFCTVELNEIKKECYIAFLEQRPNIGDYLLVHSGVAIKVVEDVEQEEIMKEFRILMSGTEESDS